MRDIVIIGAGGFAREVIWLIETINKKSSEWNIMGYIDENKNNHGKIINGYRVLGGIEWFENHKRKIYTVCAIGNPLVKEKLIKKIEFFNNVIFPTLIYPGIEIHSTNKIGEGTIICAGNILTTNITIGKHVIINLDCTIGHDAIIEDFSTVLPSVNISGNVIIKRGCMIGTGSAIIQEKTIGECSIIGAGAVVNKDIPNKVTAVGIPAKVIKKHDK